MGLLPLPQIQVRLNNNRTSFLGMLNQICKAQEVAATIINIIIPFSGMSEAVKVALKLRGPEEEMEQEEIRDS